VIGSRLWTRVACVASLTLGAHVHDAQRPAIWGRLAAGRYRIGFTVLSRRDQTRRYQATGEARGVQISVWYPAANANSGSAMRFRDYYLLTASQRTLTEPNPSDAAAAITGFIRFLTHIGASARAADAWLASPVAARREARQEKGRFPVVLIAEGSFETAYSEAILAEFLASHGFVVATSPAPLLLAQQDAPAQSTLELARTQAADLSFILDQLGTSAFADTSRVGVVAHSSGARSALLFIATRPYIGLVSLDGGIANQHGKDWLDGTDFDFSGVRNPILHFFQEVDTTVTPDFFLIERLRHSDRTLIRVDSIFHIDFSSVGFARAAIPELAVAPPVRELGAKIALVSDLTLEFLERVTTPRHSTSSSLEQLVSRGVGEFLSARRIPSETTPR
jgi:dienelactone hydrolase